MRIRSAPRSSSYNRRCRALALVPLGALALAVVPSTQASAVKPVERDRGTFGGTDDESICGVDVQIAFTGTFKVVIAPVPNSDGEPFLLRNSYTVNETWTTTDPTTPVVTVEIRKRFIEQRAEQVEGTLWRFTSQEAGTLVVRDGSGRVLLRETGVQRVVEDFDTLGDQRPSAEPVEGTFIELLRAGQYLSEDEACARLLPTLT